MQHSQKILGILETAAKAPSGDNVQPWRFRVSANRITVINVPESDTSLYNYRNVPLYIAHGALLENLVLAAQRFGMNATVRLFPEGTGSAVIATVDLIENRDPTNRNDALFSAIEARCSNRRPYDTTPLSDQALQALIGANEGTRVSMRILRNREQINRVARIMSHNERLVLENRALHDFLYSHLRWTVEEETRMGDGLLVKTLELTPPQRTALKLLRNWTLLSLLNRVMGIAGKVAQENEKAYRASAAVGALLVSGTSPQDFIAVGRTLERTWLQATALGLSFQVATGLTFLILRLRGGEDEQFSAKHRALLTQTAVELESLFQTTGETVAVLFRVGKSQPPSARSTRQPLVKLIVE